VAFSEFSQLRNASQQLIHISGDNGGMPLALVDIYPSLEAYEDRRTPSFNNLLVAKGLARYLNDSDIVSWYNTVGTKPIEPNAVSSLRWMDIHELQMPAISFAGGATGTRTSQSYSQKLVVGNVTAMQTPSLSHTAAEVATAKEVVAKVPPLPATAADRRHREKMEQVNRWLNQDTSERWKHAGVKMCVDASTVAAADAGSKSGNERQNDRASEAETKIYEAVTGDKHAGVKMYVDTSKVAAADAGSRSGNERHYGKACQTEDMIYNAVPGDKHAGVKMCVDASKVAATDAGSRSGNEMQNSTASQTVDKIYNAMADDIMASSYTSVPLQSSVVTSSVTFNPQKPGLPRSRVEMYDTPEKDINRHDRTQPSWTGSSQNSQVTDDIMSLQPSDGGQVQKSSLSKNEMSGGRSKARLSFGRGQQEKPLFSVDDSARHERRSPDPAVKKADSPEVRNSATAKPARDNIFGGHSPSFCTPDALQKPHVKTSPSLPRMETELVFPVLRPLDEENFACTSSKKSTHNEAAPSAPVAGTDLDNQARTSDKKQLHRPISSSSFCAAAANASPSHDVNEEDDVRSECSLSSLTAVETRVGESDAYLTANESSSTASVTPQKKATSVPKTVTPVTPSPAVSHRGSSFATDEESLVRNTPVAAEEPKVSRGVPPVMLAVPESRRVTVLVSEVESPQRFWVNVASEECVQVDRVTEVLNSDPSSLTPADEASGSIGLGQCCCVRSVKDGLVYRAEVVEICYGDARCKRGSMDCLVCMCDRLKRPPATAAKAVKVMSPLKER